VRLLLDTHVLIWWLRDNPQLGQQTRALISHAHVEVLFSAVSCWEASLKHRVGKMEIAGAQMWRQALAEGFEAITIQPEHLAELETLPVIARHSDPYDHLLLAQAKAEGASLVTADRAMALYGVPCIGVR
jgi:PIN domain nuclease of toxin-antitoxin system